MGIDFPAIDPHVDGAMEYVQSIVSRAASRPDTFRFTEWYRHSDGTYSKMFLLVLENGDEYHIISKKTISEREYFKRKLKYG